MIAAHLRVESRHCGSSSPEVSSFWPRSPGWLKLRSRTRRWAGWASRAEAKEPKPSSVIRQPDSLKNRATGWRRSWLCPPPPPPPAGSSATSSGADLWVPHRRVSRVHCGLLRPAASSFSPESHRLLLLRSSSFTLEELRTLARASQLLSDRLHPLSLEIRAEGRRLKATVLPRRKPEAALTEPCWRL